MKLLVVQSCSRYVQMSVVAMKPPRVVVTNPIPASGGSPNPSMRAGGRAAGKALRCAHARSGERVRLRAGAAVLAAALVAGACAGAAGSRSAVIFTLAEIRGVAAATHPDVLLPTRVPAKVGFV